MLNNQMLRVISSAEISEYNRNGVVKLANVFSLDWIEYLSHAIEHAMANPGPYGEEYAKNGGRFFGDLETAKRNPAIRNFVLHSPAAEIAGTVMEATKSNFFYDQLLVKEPGTSEPTPWHQDQPYWGVQGRQVASIWLPMDSVSKQTGLRFVKNSHTWSPHNPHHFKDNSPYQGTGLPELPDIDANPDRYEILSWDLAPGDCLVFQAMIVHGAYGNTSRSNRRRALATRWTGDDARYDTRPGTAFPTEDPGLEDGSEMTCERFPLVWQKPI